MKKHNHDDAFASFSALLDKGAEVFTKKMFKHSQSKTQERWSDMEQGRRGGGIVYQIKVPQGRV